ncbi:MAG: hypothetical protein VB859_05855, partial [Planctomycetaceae bacterium]
MTNQKLQQWVDEVAACTAAENVHWCDGSDEEIERLNQMMVEDGTLVRLDPEKHPNSFYARSDVNDVARVEDRTFICAATLDDAGPTNNWMAPDQMHAVIDPLFEGCMQG